MRSTLISFLQAIRILGQVQLPVHHPGGDYIEDNAEDQGPNQGEEEQFPQEFTQVQNSSIRYCQVIAGYSQYGHRYIGDNGSDGGDGKVAGHRSDHPVLGEELPQGDGTASPAGCWSGILHLRKDAGKTGWQPQCRWRSWRL